MQGLWGYHWTPHKTPAPATQSVQVAECDISECMSSLRGSPAFRLRRAKQPALHLLDKTQGQLCCLQYCKGACFKRRQFQAPTALHYCDQMVSECLEPQPVDSLLGSTATHLELLCLLPELHRGTQWADVFFLDDLRVAVVILHPPALPAPTQHFCRPIHACSVEPQPTRFHAS